MNATENVRGINFRLTFPEPSIYASISDVVLFIKHAMLIFVF
jgi:hypothetical protein